MDKHLIEKAVKNVAAVLQQFKAEELGNRLTQFNYMSLERCILEELKPLLADTKPEDKHE